MRVPFIYDGNIGKMEEYNQHYFRELRTRNENMLFLHQEEAFLAPRRACSRMLKGMFLSVERRRQDRRGAKNVYTFGACEKRGQRDACGRKDWDSWQDTVAKIARQRGKDGRTERSNRLKRLRQLARYRGEDSRKERSR